MNGTDASVSSDAGGGGGGGGAHGFSTTGAGLNNTTGNTIKGGAGGQGGAGTSGVGTGGGGGGEGGYGAFINSTSGNSNSGTLQGGAGGGGGNPGNGNGGNGGGGNGGIGIFFGTSGSTLTNVGLIQGGAGGNSGSGGFGFSNSSPNASAGAGGAGVAGSGITITNSSTIRGGNGGVGAASGVNGGQDSANGAGGTGIIGSNLTVTNSGAITGGLGGGGGRANAITFTGGTNVLEIQSGSIMTGNVVAFSTADTLRLGGSTNSTFDLSQLGPSGQYQGFGILAKSGSSTWTVSNTPGTTMVWQVSAGTLNLNSTSQTASSFQLTGGSLTNGTLSSIGTFDLQAGTVSAALAGTGAVNKTTNGTVTLSGANTYSGGTTLSSGEIIVGNNTALGSSILSMAAGTTLGFANTGNFTIQNNIQISGDPIFLPPSATTQTISGVISDGGTPGTVEMNGAGTLVFSGANTYSGGTKISAGTLQLSGAGTLGAASGATTVSGGTLDLGNTSQTQNGGVTLTSGTIRNGTLSSSGIFALQSGSVSAILTGSGALNKTTGGTVTLSGANTYTGVTTINVGTLALSGSGAVASSSQINLAGSGATFDISATTAGTSITTLNGVSGSIVALGAQTLTITNGSTTYAGSIQGTGGGLAITGGTQTLSGANSYTGGTTVSAGTLQLASGGTLGATANTTTVNGGTLDLGATTQTQATLKQSGGTMQNGTVDVGTYQLTGGTLASGTTVAATTTFDTQSGTVNGVLAGAGALSKSAGGTVTLSGANAYTGGTTISAGTLALSGAGTLGAASGTTTVSGGTLSIGATNQVQNGGVTLSSGLITGTSGTLSSSGMFDMRSGTVTAILAGAGAVNKTTAGLVAFSGANTYSGGTTVSGGELFVAGSGTLGNIANAVTVSGSTPGNGGILNLGGTSQTQNGGVTLSGGGILNGTLSSIGTFNLQSGSISAALAGTGDLVKSTSGTVILTGTSTYTGATNINGGTLEVLGAITNSSAVNVNAGGTLTGTGTVDPPNVGGPVTINAGGTFAPGNGTAGSSMTISGNLAFQSGAMYLVQINPSTASFANVTGTATLGGATVNAVYASGSYVAKQYMILTAGSVSGTFAPTVVNTNLPANFKTDLSYDATHAYLDLSLTFIPPPNSGLSGNQQGVGNAIINSFNSNGGISLIYSALTATGLTQASGETATGSQQTTFNAMSQFLNVLTDPFMSRGDVTQPNASPSHFAEEDDGETSAYAARRRMSAEREAYAMFTKAPLAKVYEPRWSVWAASFGGSQSTDGNALAGSNGTTSSIFGTAVGADYLLTPRTIAGFALAGGATAFSVVNGGTGRSDLFQAGAYLRHTEGNAYITGALAYGWQDITTSRTVTIAGLDQLRAEFNANAWSGRVEGGYRYVAPWIGGLGVTPYAAGQFTTFDLPAYAESVISGAPNFALSYSAKSVTDARSELGVRLDKSFALASGVLSLRGRLAWAHDFDPNRSTAATFQALPGASFVVNGAAQASDSALTTASAEMKWTNGWSAAATFEGEFSGVTRSYAGKGVVRKEW